MKKSTGLWATLKEHKWRILLGAAVSITVAILATPLRDVGEAVFGVPTFAYVESHNGQPLGDALIGNSIGNYVQVDPQGRFQPLPKWHDGSMLSIYGPPDANGKRPKLGEFPLRRRGNDEWETIRIPAPKAAATSAPKK